MGSGEGGGLEPASEELTVHWAGKESTGLESGHSPGLWGPPLPAPAALPHLARESPGPRGWGGGAFQPPPRLRREGRTPGLGREDELGATTFSGRKAGRLGFHAHAVPGESTPPETPREPPTVGGGGRRPGAGEERGADPAPAVRENFRGGGDWQGRGDRGDPAPGVPRAAPGAWPPAPRPEPCLRSNPAASRAPRRPWSCPWGAAAGGLLQPAPRSAFSGFGSNPAGRGRAGDRHEIGGRTPRPPRSLSAPPRPLARPKAFIFPYPV